MIPLKTMPARNLRLDPRIQDRTLRAIQAAEISEFRRSRFRRSPGERLQGETSVTPVTSVLVRRRAQLPQRLRADGKPNPDVKNDHGSQVGVVQRREPIRGQVGRGKWLPPKRRGRSQRADPGPHSGIGSGRHADEKIGGP